MNNCRTYLAAGALAACGLAVLLYWGLSASGLPVFSVAEFLAHSNGAAAVVRADPAPLRPDLAAQAKRKAAQAKERLKAAPTADAGRVTAAAGAAGSAGTPPSGRDKAEGGLAEAGAATGGGNAAPQAAGEGNDAARTAPGPGPLIASPLWTEANICPSCRVLNNRKRNDWDTALGQTPPEQGGSGPQSREDAGQTKDATGQTGIGPLETVQIYGQVTWVEGGPGFGSWSERLSDQTDAPATSSAPAAPAVGAGADAPAASSAPPDPGAPGSSPTPDASTAISPPPDAPAVPSAPAATTPPIAPNAQAPLFRLILADRDNPEKRMWVAVAPAAGLQARPQVGQEVFVTGALNPVSGVFEAGELISVCPARYQTAPADAPTAYGPESAAPAAALPQAAPADGEPPAAARPEADAPLTPLPPALPLPDKSRTPPGPPLTPP